jgi:hypothetical protein
VDKLALFLNKPNSAVGIVNLIKKQMANLFCYVSFIQGVGIGIFNTIIVLVSFK